MSADFTCVAWGPLEPQDGDRHMNCPVVLHNARGAAVPVEGPFPKVCGCECRTCKNAWFADRQPIMRDGEIVRRATAL